MILSVCCLKNVIHHAELGVYPGYVAFGVQCNAQSSDSLVVTSSNPLAYDTTYEIVATYDGTTAEIFIAGVLHVSESRSWNYIQSVTTLTIGAGELLGAQ